MADISKITTTYTDGTTVITASILNEFKNKINEVIDKVNGSTPVTVATPVIIISGNSAIITCATSGATIRYTTNGSTPTSSSTQYTGAITLSGATTIKAIAIKDGVSSSVATQSYTPASVAAPTIIINGNSCTMSAESGATIYYTLNGSNPTTSSSQYSSAVTLQSACTVKAIAVKSGSQSSVASATYTPSVEPDADATTIMARYSKTLSSAQQSAFNLFIVNLKNAGIYSKIKYLVLPILAADKTEATQNALSGASAFTDRGVEGITFANNGIKATEGQPVSAFNVVDSGTTYLQSNDFHVSAFNNNVIDSDKYTEEADILLGGVPVTVGKSYYKGQIAGMSYQKTGDVAGSIVTSESSSVCRASNHFVGSFSSSKEIFSITGTAVYSEGTMVVKNMNALRSPRFGCNINNTTNYETNSSSLSGSAGTSKCNYGFISWGYALTESQCTTFNTLVETLMTSFLS